MRVPVAGATSPIDADDLADCAKYAAENFSEEDAKDKASHSITAADGFTAVP